MANALANTVWKALKGYSYVAPTQRGGYRLARLARRLVPREAWRGRFTTVGDVSLELDLGTYPDCCMACGLYELDTFRTLRQIVRPGDHVVDCGANVGYFTLQAARRVGPRGRVDAFEPDPLNRRRLEENLACNGAPAQVKVHDVAVSDAEGSATLYHPAEAARNHGESSLFSPGAGQAADAYSVRTARLDEVLDRTPDVIKMDIEGAELGALRGATGLLKGERAPQWVIEHNVVSAKAAGHRPGDLLRFLRGERAGYRAYWIGWRLSEFRTPEEIDGMGREGNILYRA
jgi:FkbM family methyltransferase